MVSQSGIEFIQAWLRVCTMDSGRLLLDVLSKANEDKRFIEHRHDASILSCLSKTRKIEALPDETFYYPRWNRDGDEYPFWATRKRSGIPAWLGYYAPDSWHGALKSRLSGKPLTYMLDPEIFPELK